MRVLVACEESQVVTTAFREKGIQAFSCDIEQISGDYPEWHFHTDVRKMLDGNWDWDMILAFPPCTHLAVSGARWFKEKQADGRQQEGIDFFNLFTNLACPKVMIENPIGIMNTCYRKPDQIIQPWQFGHGEVKSTCLWLKGLPKLVPTNIVEGREPKVWKMGPSPKRSKLRSKTYLGIAKAMADQWSNY